jgi:hypothetical protein
VPATSAPARGKAFPRSGQWCQPHSFSEMAVFARRWLQSTACTPPTSSITRRFAFWRRSGGTNSAEICVRDSITVPQNGIWRCADCSFHLTDCEPKQFAVAIGPQGVITYFIVWPPSEIHHILSVGRSGKDGKGHLGAQLLMTMAAQNGLSAHPEPGPVAAVITICAHRKRTQPPSEATPVSLPIGPQDVVQTAWMERVRALPPNAPASALYAGRGLGLATQAAKLADAKFYILSAGLGLVASDRQVPLYGLTVSGRHTESVATRVAGEFDVAAWFSGLLSGPHSGQWADAMAQGPGRVLIALTRPYAEMVGESLSSLEPQSLARLRIFGRSLAPVLPAALHPMIAPYDTRLDAVLPGTRADFSQRALLHFIRSVAVKGDAEDREADYAAVEAVLRGVTAPDRLRRPRRSDIEILQLIMRRLQSQSGIGRILRALRDEEGVACEQARFSRLYRTALQQLSAA